MNRSFTFQGIASYITSHNHKISSRYFQSSAFPLVMDFVNSMSSTGEVTIAQGRKTTGAPLLVLLKDKPNKEELKVLTLEILKYDDLKVLASFLKPGQMYVVRKDKTPEHVGPIAGYLIKATAKEVDVSPVVPVSSKDPVTSSTLHA